MPVEHSAPSAHAEIWDAIVVGAGPAGCAAAYDLAAAGRRVLLLDRAAFPRPKACAGGLTLKAVRALRYSIHPVIRLHVRSLVLESPASPPAVLGRRAPVCAMTMREELDAYCLDQTLQRGAVFRRIGSILGMEQADGGVTLHCGGGERFEARYLIGADGVHSRIRALSGPSPWFRTGFAVEANVPYRNAPSRNVPYRTETEIGRAMKAEHYPLTFDFAAIRDGYGWLFPRDTHVNVGLYTAVCNTGSAEDVPLPGRRALDAYIAARCGGPREHSPAVGQFLGFGATAYAPAPGTRVLLAGDAAGFVDPLTGEGIYGAIRSGQAAAAAVHAALGSGASPASPAAAPNAALHTQYAQHTSLLRGDLAVAEHAARRFYPQPVSGFRLLRLPLLPRFALRTYAEGSSLAVLLHAARFTRRLARVVAPGSG